MTCVYAKFRSLSPSVFLKYHFWLDTFIARGVARSPKVLMLKSILNAEWVYSEEQVLFGKVVWQEMDTHEHTIV